MALTLYASVGSTTTQLNDGAPFRFESLEGASGSDVVRYEQRGPSQSGATDLGFRFEARTITLNLVFYATTAALLDTYRSTLMAAFKPLDSTSIFLSVQRDDSEIRTLTCHTVGDIDIALAPELYPGHTHRATVNLRAAKPLWNANAVTQGSATFTALGSWWTAGGNISTANVLNHYEYPAAGTVAAFGGSAPQWTVAFVTSKDTASVGTAIYAWSDGTGGTTSFGRLSTGEYFITEGATSGTATWPGTTGYNYHAVDFLGGQLIWWYWTGGTIAVSKSAIANYNLRGPAFGLRRLRSTTTNNWTPELRKIAIYGTISSTEIYRLGPYMLDQLPGTVTLVNDGDVYAYPLITLQGPMADPVIVNTTTSGTLDLTGLTFGSVTVITIDLRDGNKQIYDQGGSSWIGSVTTLPVSMAGFSLAPAPIAAGGTNVLVMTPGSVGSAAYFQAQITNQYMSF